MDEFSLTGDGAPAAALRLIPVAFLCGRSQHDVRDRHVNAP
jgi:hypothetical protein